jgi:glycosyltransferase involved in cell wall biosynthesis
MNIGITPVLDPSFGGIYQYSQTMLDILRSQVIQQREDKFILFLKDFTSDKADGLRASGWDVRPFFPPDRRYQFEHEIQRLTGVNLANKIWRLSQQISRGAGIDRVRPLPEVSRWLKQYQIDLMIFPAPDELAFKIDLPYVMAIHDLQHRLQPSFPEISAGGNAYWREYLFRNAARYATLLISESEVGKQDILSFYGAYGVAGERIKVLPFLPAISGTGKVSEQEIQRVRSTYNLPERYLFYPAQFWLHKNHARIVQALDQLDNLQHVKIPVVFVGTHTGRQRNRNFARLQALIRELGMQDQVLFPGYVPDQDMPGLYAGATALIMPTFFGPSNIPVLEAWAYGCPVITSDIHGIREQCGDAALWVDPNSVDAIAEGIYRIWTDKALSQDLVEEGLRRLSSYTRDDYITRLCDILDEGKKLVLTGRNRATQQGGNDRGAS